MQPLEFIELLALPIAIVLAAICISISILALAKSTDGAPTDNYEIALRLTKMILSEEGTRKPSSREGIEEEYLKTYERLLKKSSQIDF